MQGAGESGFRGQSTAKPLITGKKTGWAAETSLSKGPIDAYGVIEGKPSASWAASPSGRQGLGFRAIQETSSDST